MSYGCAMSVIKTDGFAHVTTCLQNPKSERLLSLPAGIPIQPGVRVTASTYIQSFSLNPKRANSGAICDGGS